MNAPRSPRVVVVDDSKTMRKMIIRALGFCGVEPDQIAEAENGREALDLLELGLPELLVSDVNMPVMDGTQLLEQIVERGFIDDLPVVMCTSVTASRTLAALVRMGAHTVIRKPFVPTALAGKLGEVLDRAETAAPSAAPAPEVDERPVVDEAVRTLLGEMVFMDAAPEDLAPREYRVLYGAEVVLSLASATTLRVETTRDGCTAIALNLTGSDPEDDDRARLDAIAEVVNVLAGVLFERLGPDEQVDGLGFGTPTSTVRLPAPGETTLAAYRLDGGDDVLFVSLIPASAELRGAA